MIFAAGFGTRMQPLTLTRPKPLIEVAGKTLIDRTLELSDAIAPDVTVVNLHYKSNLLEAHLQGRGVVTVTESPDILDTGGGLKNALPFLNSNPVVTSNSDAIWIGPNPFQCLLQSWDPKKMDALLLCIPFVDCIGRKGTGDFELDAKYRLSRGDSYVFGGIQMMKTDDLNTYSKRAFSLNEIWDLIKTRERLYGAVYPGRWCDIGTPDGIGLAENALAQFAHE